MNIIGISGKPGAEKFVYAFRIIQELRFHGQHCSVVSLATPLYEDYNAIADAVAAGVASDEIVEAWALGPRGEEFLTLIDLGSMGPKAHYGYSRRNETVRKGLTFLGSTIRRSQDEDYFVKRLLVSTLHQPGFGVLTDLRYPNEADRIREAGGLALRANLVSNNDEGGYKYEAGRQDASETALDDYGGFYAHLFPQTFDRVAFGLEILDYYDLPGGAETIR